MVSARTLILEYVDGNGASHIRQMHIQIMRQRPGTPEHTIRARLSEAVADGVLGRLGEGFYDVYAEDEGMTSVVSYPSLAMITDTRHTFGMGLDDIIRQVRSRHDLYYQNIYELEQGKCEAMNEVFQIKAEQGKPADSRQVYFMNKRIMDLYEQQRRERATLWQDISKLRQTLPETAQQYLAAYRKTAILNDTSGDVP